MRIARRDMLISGTGIAAALLTGLGSSVAEITRYIAEGLDGFFTDDPALGRRAIDGAPAS